MERKKKTMLDFNNMKSNIRLLRKQKKEIVRQSILLKEALQDAIERIDSYQLTPEVCGLLGHPQPKGSLFCYCKCEMHASSGQVIASSDLVVTSCSKSPNALHCWHRTLSNVVIPGKTRMDEQCCFCGETKQTEVELPPSYSYSYDAAKHGPYAPVYQVLY